MGINISQTDFVKIIFFCNKIYTINIAQSCGKQHSFTLLYYYNLILITNCKYWKDIEKTAKDFNYMTLYPISTFLSFWLSSVTIITTSNLDK